MCNKVCIIDSGYNKNHPSLANINVVKEICFTKKDDEIFVDEVANDSLGHGTAVTSIIYSSSPNSEYIIVKIFDDKWECSEELLIFALQYIYNNINCDYINISSGLTTLKEYEILKELCEQFEKKHILIISAFDNSGAVSYPAYFNNVIGVDSDTKCKNREEFIHVKNSMVNVFGYGNIQRVAWTQPDYMFVSGSSFACANITGYLARADIKGFDNANAYLREKAKWYIEFPIITKKKIPYKIKRAVVFPYNKEIKGLIDNSNVLEFDIINIFDLPQMGNVGKKMFSLDKKKSYDVKNINKLDWSCNFDTVILGHTREINNIYGYNVAEDLLKKCIEYNKNIYSFDPINQKLLSEYADKIFFPQTNFKDTSFGKLFDIKVPVIGILGTSSKQGKFTLQMTLREKLIKYGYFVGQVGTEPTALLCGMDEMFHIGYNSVFDLSSADFVECVNHALNDLQVKGVEIIVGGCQSNTIPYSVKNTRYLNHRQSEFLIGLNPDAVILCINIFDDFDYIERSINYIESLSDGKVVALVIFPLGIPNIWAPNYRKIIDSNAIHGLKKVVSLKTNIPCYILGENSEMDDLFNNIIDYFTE